MADTHIKIKPVTPRVQYTANGSTTVFPYSFAIFDETDMVVYVDDTIITTGYTVSGAGQTDGGNVTFDSAPVDGTIITLLRNVPIERMTDFQEGGTFRPKNINDEFDRQTAFAQQVQEALSRCVKVDPTSESNPEEILPKVEELYDDIDNINAVAGDLANVDTVAGNKTNINAVAGNASNINTVAGVSGNVTTVAGISANVTAVAGNAVNINSVAGNKTNIDTVAGNSSNIATVAGISSDISSIVSDLTNINNVAADLTNIDAVAGELPSIITKANTDASNFTATGKSYLAGLGMPSDTYEDLTLLAAGQTYTAPANGWVVFDAQHSSSGYVFIGSYNNNNQGIGTTHKSTGSGGDTMYIPVKKNDTFIIDYTNLNTGTSKLRFCYAKGSESEAS